MNKINNGLQSALKAERGKRMVWGKIRIYTGNHPSGKDEILKTPVPLEGKDCILETLLVASAIAQDDLESLLIPRGDLWKFNPFRGKFAATPGKGDSFGYTLKIAATKNDWIRLWETTSQIDWED